MSKKQIFAIIAASLFFDALSAIPVANLIVVAVGQFVMAILFKQAGIAVWRGRSAWPFGLGTLIELVPGLSSLPLFFVESVAILLLSGRKLR
jgi:hypothetical protein